MADGNVYGNLINGEWVKGDKTFNDINPSDTNDVIGVYAQAGEAEVQAAIKAAREAFQTWQFSAYLDVLNIYNRGNPEGVSYNYNYTKQSIVTGLPILPVLGIRGEL